MLHGVSAYAPWSIDLCTMVWKLMLHGACFDAPWYGVQSIVIHTVIHNYETVDALLWFGLSMVLRIFLQGQSWRLTSPLTPLFSPFYTVHERESIIATRACARTFILYIYA